MSELTPGQLADRLERQDSLSGFTNDIIAALRRAEAMEKVVQAVCDYVSGENSSFKSLERAIVEFNAAHPQKE